MYLCRFEIPNLTPMRMNKLFQLLLFLTGFLTWGNAQNVTLIVTTFDGTEYPYQMAEESQLYFNNGESLVIEDVTGTTTTFPLSEIRKIVCDEVTSVDESSAVDLQLLPNPARNSFLIKNLQDSCPARIYTLDGRLVMSFTAYEGQLVDISPLTSGMYLLHINGQTLKMMKL